MGNEPELLMVSKTAQLVNFMQHVFPLRLASALVKVFGCLKLFLLAGTRLFVWLSKKDARCMLQLYTAVDKSTVSEFVKTGRWSI